MKINVNLPALNKSGQAGWTTVAEKTLVRSAILAIDFYRNFLSRLMLPRCRFIPSCSAYAREAIEKKGLWRGLGMALRRLFHCHPFSRACVYDPVK